MPHLPGVVILDSKLGQFRLLSSMLIALPSASQQEITFDLNLWGIFTDDREWILLVQ